MNRPTITLAAAAVLLATVPTAATADVARPMCHLNDDGTWTYVADHYDDARDGGHVADRMPNADGTCSWPAVVTPAPAPLVRTVTVVRTRVVTVRCVVVRRPGPDARRCVRKVRWSR